MDKHVIGRDVNVPDPVSAWLGFKILQVFWFTELHNYRDHMNRVPRTCILLASLLTRKNNLMIF